MNQKRIKKLRREARAFAKIEEIPGPLKTFMKFVKQESHREKNKPRNQRPVERISRSPLGLPSEFVDET